MDLVLIFFIITISVIFCFLKCFFVLFTKTCIWIHGKKCYINNIN